MESLLFVAPSLADTLDENSLPFSVPVDKKVSVADINNIQRDHFEDSQYDMRYTLAAGHIITPGDIMALTLRRNAMER